MSTQNNHSNFKTFIARKRYKGLSLNRDNLNIPAGSMLSCKGDILFYNNIPVAFVTSQVILLQTTMDVAWKEEKSQMRFFLFQ